VPVHAVGVDAAGVIVPACVPLLGKPLVTV